MGDFQLGQIGKQRNFRIGDACDPNLLSVFRYDGIAYADAEFQPILMGICLQSSSTFPIGICRGNHRLQLGQAGQKRKFLFRNGSQLHRETVLRVIRPIQRHVVAKIQRRIALAQAQQLRIIGAIFGIDCFQVREIGQLPNVRLRQAGEGQLCDAAVLIAILKGHVPQNFAFGHFLAELIKMLRRDFLLPKIQNLSILGIKFQFHDCVLAHAPNRRCQQYREKGQQNDDQKLFLIHRNLFFLLEKTNTLEKNCITYILCDLGREKSRKFSESFKATKLFLAFFGKVYYTI